MASTHKHLRSSTADKRPTTAIAEGQIALNTNAASPGLYFKDSTGASIIKVGPVHVGTTAPNVTPPSGGSSGNSTGEVWLDTSLTPAGVKIWNGSAWVNATPVGSTTVQGLLELATNAETQTGTDTERAVTPAALQSKVSDSISTTSSTTIASSTAVKTAYDLANAALARSGGTVTGNLEIGTTGSLSFEGSVADGFETTIAVTNPTADRTITLPDTTGTVVTTGDTGTVTSAMIANGTIVNDDINASAAIAHNKLADITAGQVLLGNASNVPTATALSGDVTVSSTGVTAIGSGVIVNADVNASAAIAGTKINPDFGAQNVTTTGTSTAASFIPSSATVPTNGIYLSAANSVSVATNSTQRLLIDSAGQIEAAGLGSAAAPAWSYVGDPDTGIYSPGANTLAASTAGNERARIDSSGRLLVGTSTALTNVKRYGQSIAPAQQIVTNDTINWNTGLGLFNYSAAGYAPILSLGLSGSDTKGTNTLISADKRMGVITFNGNDGTDFEEGARIEAYVDGTPGANDMPGRLVFSTTADGAALPTERMRIDSTGFISLGGDTNTGFSNPSADNLAITTGGSERARIDSSGRLLVGTSSTNANTKLMVQGGASTNSANVYFARADATPANGDPLGYLIFSDSNHGDAAYFHCARDGGTWNTSTSRPTRLVFSTTADGASSPTERLRITSTGQVRLAGAGITFNGDTATANELDDYEEGTFTPTAVGATTAGTGTYSIQQGYYTKVGRLVTFSVYMVWSAHTGTGAARVGGLPFTAGGTNGHSAVSLWLSSFTLAASNIAVGYVLPTTTQVVIQQYPVGGGGITSPDLDTAANIMVAGQYIVA